MTENDKYLADLYHREVVRLSEKANHYNALNMQAGITAGAALAALLTVIFTGTTPHYSLLAALPFILIMWYFYVTSFMNALLTDGAVIGYCEERINELTGEQIMLRESFLHKHYHTRIYRAQTISYGVALLIFALLIFLIWYYRSAIGFWTSSFSIGVSLLFAGIAYKHYEWSMELKNYIKSEIANKIRRGPEKSSQ